ncbi:MAG: hypothetical protein AB7O96_05970 [Pseudobdellovibrionaceae bacterium]
MTHQPTWLPLTDYSTKYKVSVSTLRRRIKADDIRYRFDDGKYFISDEPLSSHTRGDTRPSLKLPPVLPPSKLPDPQPLVGAQPALSQDVLPSVNHLLGELKKAYTSILQEKEEQILLLKEEIADLKTLVSVLESENERLKLISLSSPPSTVKRSSLLDDDLFSSLDL